MHKIKFKGNKQTKQFFSVDSGALKPQLWTETELQPVVLQSFNFSAAPRKRRQGHLWEFQASQGYIMRLCLKKQNPEHGCLFRPETILPHLLFLREPPLQTALASLLLLISLAANIHTLALPCKSQWNRTSGSEILTGSEIHIMYLAHTSHKMTLFPD